MITYDRNIGKNLYVVWMGVNDQWQNVLII